VTSLYPASSARRTSILRTPVLPSRPRFRAPSHTQSGVGEFVVAACAQIDGQCACAGWGRNLMDVPFPTLPDKHGYRSAYRVAAFLDALRAGGWEPGPVP
jgi:hypothetical protein